MRIKQHLSFGIEHIKAFMSGKINYFDLAFSKLFSNVVSYTVASRYALVALIWLILSSNMAAA